MADPAARRNESARTRAREAGAVTYSHDVVEAWPACVECATPIRHRAGERGYYRRCGCLGVRWRCGLDGSGWRRVEPEETA